MPEPTHPTMGHRVLVVDDSPTILEVAELVLQGAGFVVTSVDSGGRTLEVAHEFRPHLILLDFAMPGTNGFEVCRRLGEDDALRDVPIIVMNNRGDPVGERFIREMGIVDHILKPFAADALIAVVQHTLEKTRNTDPGILRRPLLWQQPPPETSMTAATRVAQLIATAIGDCPRGPQRLARIETTLMAPETGPDLNLLAFERNDGHALTGDLSIISIAEVLQLLQLQRQSGRLSVKRGQTLVTIVFDSGAVRLVTGEGLPTEFLLGNILVQEKLIEPAELDVLLSNRRGTRRRLGTQVVQLGYLSGDQLQAALRRQSSELIYMMLRWGSGRFAFNRDEQLSPDALEFQFGLGIDELLMEGYRRVDEWGMIEDAIPSFDLIPHLAPDAGLRALSLTDDERVVLRLVDGVRTVHDIIKEHGRGTFAGAGLLYRLVAGRVVVLPQAQNPTTATSMPEAGPTTQRARPQQVYGGLHNG